MKKILAVIALAFASVSAAHATTHFNLGDGEILISKDGQRAALISKTTDTGVAFVAAAPLMNQNGCDVQIFSNVDNVNDMLTVTLCERNRPFVKFSRYEGSTKLGQWLVDASRYVSFDDK